MTLSQRQFDGRDMVQVAIDRVKEFCPPEGYYVAFSGGKDSIVIKDLVLRAGVKHDIHYHVTTVDPPEVLRFIREFHPDVEWHRPQLTMWQLIVKKRMPPTRQVRYCCEYLKERGGAGRFVATGIRWAESNRRARRGLIETCKRDSTRRFIHPIIDWSNADVWAYTKERGLPYCCLYDEGFDRIGCIMCPMAEKRRHQDAERWPQYKRAYIRAFQKMVDKRITDGLPTEWRTGQEVYDWWMQDPKKKHEDQGCMLF